MKSREYASRCLSLQEALLVDKDEDGNTALMLAVESGKYNFVNFIIKRGIV